MSRSQRILVWTALLGLSTAAFLMYLQPAFLVTLAEQLWACF